MMSVSAVEVFDRGLDEAGLLTRLRRRKVLFAVVFLLITAAVGVVYKVTPVKYLAGGAVIVTADAVNFNGDLSPAAEQKLGDPADMDSQIIVAKSPRLMKEMLLRPEVVSALHEDCEVTSASSSLNSITDLIRPRKSCDVILAGSGALNWLEDHFVISSAGRSRVILIDYQSHSPQVAASLVNGLIESYLAQGTSDKQRSREQAETWIKAQRDFVGRELRQAELEIENFRRDHGLVRGEVASINSEQLTQVDQQYAAAKAAWSDAGAKLAQLRKGAGDARDTLESRAIGDLKQKLTDVSGQIALAMSRYGKDYPGLLALEKQRADLQRHLSEETGRVSTSVERQYASAYAVMESLRQQLDKLKHDVGVGDLAETQIASMVRDAEVRRELYVDLSKKASDLEAQRRLLTGDVQLVNFAEVPTSPFSPKLSMFVLAGVLAGSVVASAAAVLKDRADPAVRTSGRLETMSGTRVLGYIPTVRRLRGGYARSAGQLLRRPSSLQEAVRSLYTKAVLLGGGSRPRSILLTSGFSGEGKSFLTLAMAQFGASAGQRILAIEGDMRRPGFRKALALADGPGLADILRATTGYENAVRRTNFGFDVILSGEATASSTELLSNGRINGLLSWAGERYDLILIDSPPSQVLMDAHLLASRVDGVLHCARWGYSSVDAVAASVRSLRDIGGNIIGLAVGMVQPREYRLYQAIALPSGPYLMAPG